MKMQEVMLFEICSGICVNTQLRNLSILKGMEPGSKNVVCKPSSEKDA